MATIEAPAKTPEVGTEVWHRLRFNREWVPARIIDRIPGSTDPLDPPLEEGQVHLSIQLDRARHHSASSTGFRFNVAAGLAPGCWALERPKDSDAVFAKEQETERLRIELRKEELRRTI